MAGTISTRAPIVAPTATGNGKIAFFSTRDGTGEVYLMESNGASPTRLTHSTGPTSYCLHACHFA